MGVLADDLNGASRKQLLRCGEEWIRRQLHPSRGSAAWLKTDWMRVDNSSPRSQIRHLVHCRWAPREQVNTLQERRGLFVLRSLM